MRFDRLITVVFYFISTIFGFNTFAYSTSISNVYDSRENDLVALVRIENNRAKCVVVADQSRVINSSLQLPFCISDGDEAILDQMALSEAQAGVPVQLALLSHIGMGVAGCLYGVTGAMLGASIQSDLSDNRRSDQGGMIAGAIVTGTIGHVVLKGSIAEPTGHLLAGWAGIVICGGGISYLVYQAQSKRANLRPKSQEIPPPVE